MTKPIDQKQAKSTLRPECRKLTPEEIESLRREMKASSEWAKQQLAIDPELKHL